MHFPLYTKLFNHMSMYAHSESDCICSMIQGSAPRPHWIFYEIEFNWISLFSVSCMFSLDSDIYLISEQEWAFEADEHKKEENIFHMHLIDVLFHDILFIQRIIQYLKASANFHLGLATKSNAVLHQWKIKNIFFEYKW